MPLTGGITEFLPDRGRRVNTLGNEPYGCLHELEVVSLWYVEAAKGSRDPSADELLIKDVRDNEVFAPRALVKSDEVREEQAGEGGPVNAADWWPYERVGYLLPLCSGGECAIRHYKASLTRLAR